MSVIINRNREFINIGLSMSKPKQHQNLFSVFSLGGIPCWYVDEGKTEKQVVNFGFADRMMFVNS